MKDRVYTYKDYLEHLKSGKCFHQRMFSCPLDCGKSGDKLTPKMNYRALVKHLNHSCPLVKLEC